MTDTLTVGMLGAGFIGTFHSFALRMQELIKSPLPFDIRLKEIVDLDEATREVAMRRFRWEKGGIDWAALTDDSEAQVFVNAGPNNLHSEPSTRALANGKHVFCEKPLAENADRALEMWNAARSSGRVHQAA